MCLRFAEDNAQTKVNLYFTSEVCNCLDQFSAPMVLQTLSDEKFNDSFQFQTEKRKISRRRSRTSDYAGIANVTFLFCRRQQNNVQIFFMARVQRVRYLLRRGLVKGAASRLNGLKSLSKLFNFVVCNLSQSSPSLAILVLLWFIISLMFSYLYKVLFLGFLQFQGNLVDGQNNF